MEIIVKEQRTKKVLLKCKRLSTINKHFGTELKQQDIERIRSEHYIGNSNVLKELDFITIYVY
jgi:hypothetical protein